MKKRFFTQLETLAQGDSIERSQVLEQLQFNDQGLIPAIAQQHDTGEVLMLAWMNREALEQTLTTRWVCYWSRSRQSLWRKGETSGHRQLLKELRIDCDGDTLLCLVDQQGPACHTDRINCFYLRVDDDGVTVIADPLDAQ